jgi:hypothetical protein
MTHTPGPWTVNDNWLTNGDYGDDFCKLEFFDDSAESSKANANLIAAAPELLEALSDFIGFFNSPNVTISGKDNYGETKGQWAATIREARSAINKAKTGYRGE